MKVMIKRYRYSKKKVRVDYFAYYRFLVLVNQNWAYTTMVCRYWFF